MIVLVFAALGAGELAARLFPPSASTSQSYEPTGLLSGTLGGAQTLDKESMARQREHRPRLRAAKGEEEAGKLRWGPLASAIYLAGVLIGAYGG